MGENSISPCINLVFDHEQIFEQIFQHVAKATC